MDVETGRVEPVLLPPPPPPVVRPPVPAAATATPVPMPNMKLLAPMPVSPPQDIPMKSAETAAPTAAFTSPQSKRNLEIIAEAIRHLEGDNCLFDRKEPSASLASPAVAAHNDFRSSHLGSEESQTESSTSDQEDSKSESSGRSSPVPTTIMASHHHSRCDYVPVAASSVGPLERQTATLHVSAPTHQHVMPVATVQMLHPYGQFLIHKS